MKANLYDPQSVAEAIAGLQVGFGMAGMLALVVHSAAVELYLGLTPGESERLRQVSHERRLERGLEKRDGAGEESQSAANAAISEADAGV